MKYLLLLKKLLKDSLEKIQLSHRCKIDINTSFAFFALFFLAFLFPLVSLYFFFQNVQKFSLLDKKISYFEKIAKDLKKKEEGSSSYKNLEEIFQQAAIKELPTSLANSEELQLMDVFKNRQEELKLKSPIFIKSEKETSFGLKEARYDLASPLEVSSYKLIKLLQEVEGNLPKILGDQFFLKLNINEKKIADGYTTFSLEASLLKREK